MKVDDIPKLPEKIPTEAELMSTWEGCSDKPLLTVVCPTYNHQSFIRDAIHGFLIQRTTFPFRVVIHDDASTDNTAEIVRDFESRYPNVITAICQSENLRSRRLSRAPYIRPYLAGSYRATCEGDDYWTDPNKLQIQVEFLEANPEYVMSGHDAFILDEGGALVSPSKLPESKKRDFDSDDLIFAKAWILTMSWVYRNVLPAEVIPERKYILNGDTFTTSLLGRYGGSKYHPEILPSCYRQHSGGIWSSKDSSTQRDDRVNTYFWIYRYYKRQGDLDIANRWKKKWQAEVLRTIDYKDDAFSTVPTKDILRSLIKRTAPFRVFGRMKRRLRN